MSLTVNTTPLLGPTPSNLGIEQSPIIAPTVTRQETAESSTTSAATTNSTALVALQANTPITSQSATLSLTPRIDMPIFPFSNALVGVQLKFLDAKDLCVAAGTSTQFNEVAIRILNNSQTLSLPAQFLNSSLHAGWVQTRCPNLQELSLTDIALSDVDSLPALRAAKPEITVTESPIPSLRGKCLSLVDSIVEKMDLKPTATEHRSTLETFFDELEGDIITNNFPKERNVEKEHRGRYILQFRKSIGPFFDKFQELLKEGKKRRANETAYTRLSTLTGFISCYQSSALRLPQNCFMEPRSLEWALSEYLDKPSELEKRLSLLNIDTTALNEPILGL